MNENIINPIEHMINLCDEHNLTPKFDIFNARDELKCLKGGLDYLRKENEKLKEKISELQKVFSIPIGYARINEHYDIYSFSTCLNPHLDPSTVVPIYTDLDTFKKWINKHN